VIPELKGMGARDAMFLLGQMGLKVRITGMGKVVSQTLLPGTVAHKGQTILLNLE
jgi:cell division protein FtsI (penicillin-binding protein 3)